MNFERMKQISFEIRYIRKLIKKYGESLLTGRYRMYPSMRAIVADKEQSIKSADPYFDKGKKVTRLTELINVLNKANCFYNRKNSSAEKYEAIYSANNYDDVREVKLFSFERKKILTICVSTEDCEKQLSEYERLHEYFGMPTVRKQDRYDNAYTIAMVDLMIRPAERLVLENIVQCVSAYGRDNPEKTEKKRASEIVGFDYSGEETNLLLSSLVSRISSDILDTEISICLQHGDLSRDNLIYGKCEDNLGFWWIDWEHARKRLFFYDYFFYMLNTAVYFSDATALKAYFNGKCDSHLEKYFAQFELKYEPRYRKDYFLIFVVDFLKERVCDRGNINALKMYCSFINAINYG